MGVRSAAGEFFLKVAILNFFHLYSVIIWNIHLRKMFLLNILHTYVIFLIYIGPMSSVPSGGLRRFSVQRGQDFMTPPLSS